MNKYRRIEVQAFRRRLSTVSGEWRPGDLFDAQAAQTDDGVSLNDLDECEPVEPDSPEGQLILVEAVRSLERRLSPEIRAAICADRNAVTSNDLSRKHSYFKFRSVYGFIPRILRFIRKEKWNDAAKQSVER